MLTNVLDYLEKTVSWLPEKQGFRDPAETISFRQTQELARGIGSFLASSRRRDPVVLLMPGGPRMTAAFLGCLYAGCTAVPLEADLPRLRLEQILEQVQPKVILYEDPALLAGSPWFSRCTAFADAVMAPIRPETLARIRAAHTDRDPACVCFQSGGEGKPRGVVLTHRNLLDMTETLAPLLGSSCGSVFGCQSTQPFFANLREILCTLRDGGCACWLPRDCFSSPIRLVEGLNQESVTTICWTSDVLTMISSRNTFLTMRPQNLTTVAFSGEPFSTRQLLLWQKVLPNARFLQLYGTAEASWCCCAYQIQRKLCVSETIPLGTPLPNTSLVLLDENGREADSGEICVRGSCLAAGFFREPKATAKAFPTDPIWSEQFLRTGDYGRWNERGELILLGRRDGRICRKGRRVEPGEIEAAARSHPGLLSACCQFEEKAGRLQLFYTGSPTCRELTDWLRQRLSEYMLPDALFLLEFMPLTPAGTIDRKLLRSNSRKGVYAYETALASPS